MAPTLAKLLELISAMHEAPVETRLSKEQRRCRQVVLDAIKACTDQKDTERLSILDKPDLKHSMNILRVIIRDARMHALELRLEAIRAQIRNKKTLRKSLNVVLGQCVLINDETSAIVKSTLEEQLQLCKDILRTLEVDEHTANTQLATIDRETRAASDGDRRRDYSVNDAYRNYEDGSVPNDGGGYDAYSEDDFPNDDGGHDAYSGDGLNDGGGRRIYGGDDPRYSGQWELQ